MATRLSRRLMDWQGAPSWNVRIMSEGYTLAVLVSRPDKALEQRMRLMRFTLELGMKLARDEKGMLGMFDDFHQLSIRCLTAEDKARFLEEFPVSVVEFKAVAMPLLHDEGAI